MGWLGLPAEAATAFVMGFVRRDFGAAGFFTMNLTDAQLLVAMVTITLFVPCIASVMVILKERGVALPRGAVRGSVGLAFLLGGLMLAAAWGWRDGLAVAVPRVRSFASGEIRCPRCYALKISGLHRRVLGCAGRRARASRRSRWASGRATPPWTARISGKPLER